MLSFSVAKDKAKTLIDNGIMPKQKQEQERIETMKSTLRTIIAATIIWTIGAIAENETSIHLSNGTSQVNINTGGKAIETFVMLAMKPERRAIKAAELIRLMMNDGAKSGAVETGIISVSEYGADGNYPYFSVSATPTMLENIRRSLEHEGGTGNTVTKADFENWVMRDGLTINREYPSTGIDIVRYEPKNRPAEELQVFIKDMLSEVGSISYIAEKLVYADSPDNLQYIKERLDDYDIPPKFQGIQVFILETESGFSRNIGLYWKAFKESARSAKLGTRIVNGAWVGGEPKAGFTTTEINGTGISLEALLAFFNFIEKEGVARVDTRVELSVANRQEGKVGDEDVVPYFIQGQEVPQYKTIGTNLYINPSIQSDHSQIFINLHHETVRSLDPLRTHILSLQTNMPTIPGEIRLLSETKTQDASNDNVGMPWLRKVPVLKFLASRTGKTRGSKSSCILLRIVPNGEDPDLIPLIQPIKTAPSATTVHPEAKPITPTETTKPKTSAPIKEPAVSPKKKRGIFSRLFRRRKRQISARATTPSPSALVPTQQSESTQTPAPSE